MDRRTVWKQDILSVSKEGIEPLKDKSLRPWDKGLLADLFLHVNKVLKSSNLIKFLFSVMCKSILYPV